MTFTKKTWNPSDKILTTDLNRIETGIDDIYAQNMNFQGHKTFVEEIGVTGSGNKVKFDIGSTSKCEIAIDDSFNSVSFRQYSASNDSFMFYSPTGSLGDVALKTINGVYLEKHADRHKNGGDDAIIRTPTVVVAPTVSGGDFTNLRQAVFDLRNTGGTIYVREGIYDEGSTSISVNSNISIIGAGIGTNIVFSGNGCLIGNCERWSVSNLKITNTGGDFVLKNFYGSTCLITDAYINSPRGITTNGKCIIENCNITSSFTTVYVFDGSCLINNNVINGIVSNIGISVYGAGSSVVISNNIIVGGTGGVLIDSTCNMTLVSNNHLKDLSSYGYYNYGTRTMVNGLICENCGTSHNNGPLSIISQIMEWL